MKSVLKQRRIHLVLASALALGGISVSNHSFAVEGSAQATATVIEPISISDAQNLVFGKFAPGAGGTVTVSTSGARSTTGPVLSSVGDTPTAARFDVSGDADATYAITYTGTSTELSDGVSGTMALTTFSDLTGGNATDGTATTGLLTGSAQSIYVGGTLAVGANQPSGIYTGNIKVQVEYN